MLDADADAGTVVGEIALMGVTYPHHAYLDAAGDLHGVVSPP